MRCAMSPEQPPRRRRSSIRLPDYDYRWPGAYFVTICTYERQLLFDDPRLHQIAEFNWAASFAIRDEIDPDVFVVMPNHMHAIVWINDANVGAQGLAPVPGRAQGLAPLRGGPGRPHVAPRSLGSLVRGYKSSVTRDVNALLGT